MVHMTISIRDVEIFLYLPNSNIVYSFTVVLITVIDVPDQKANRLDLSCAQDV